jgi:hypothetical protein
MADFLRHAATNVRRPDRKEGEELIPMREFRKELNQKMDQLRMDKEFARRYVNDGFSGGEMKRAEILQLAMLRPKFAILDETDSGLDVDAVRLASQSIADIGGKDMGILIVCRGPIRKEAIDVFREMGIANVGILLSERDSIVFPRALSPELRMMGHQHVHAGLQQLGDQRREALRLSLRKARCDDDILALNVTGAPEFFAEGLECRALATGDVSDAAHRGVGGACMRESDEGKERTSQSFECRIHGVGSRSRPRGAQVRRLGAFRGACEGRLRGPVVPARDVRVVGAVRS